MEKLINYEKYFLNEKFGRIEDYDDLYKQIDMNDIQSIKSSLDKGIDLNYKDEFGNTPTIYAASKSKPRLVKLFLDNGADPDIKNNCGNTFRYYFLDLGEDKCYKNSNYNKHIVTQHV